MNNKLYTDTPIHPGSYLEEIYECNGLTLYEFSQRINISECLLRDIIIGDSDIDESLDTKMHEVFGFPKGLLFNMQKDYNDNVEHNKEKN
jgi:plasmid maintenance system antidote protein VapI